MKTLPYDKSLYTAPFYETFFDYLNGIGSLYAERPAVSWFTRKQDELTITYGELSRRSIALRRGLRQTGLVQDTHVAIISENSVDWLTAFLSVTSFGCVAVCVDTEQSDDNIRDMVCRSDSRIIFLSPTYLPICLPLLDEQKVDQIILMGGTCPDSRVITMDALRQQGLQLMDAGEEEPFTVDKTKTAALVFTSGTTSQSKMVMLSQQGIMQNLREECYHVYLYDRMFTALPFYHAYGLNCAVLSPLLRGIHVYINGNLKTAMRDLKLAKADTTLMVPLMVDVIHNLIWLSAEKAGKTEELRKQLGRAKLMRKLHLPYKSKLMEQLRNDTVGTLRLVVSGGARLNPEICEEFELFGMQLIQGYGITECSPLISANRNFANKYGSVGTPLASLEVKVVDDEVCVRGLAVMQGYYKDPEETALVLKDGWFHTGDLGYLDKDGFLFLTGRAKNLIVLKNGKKVSPEHLEELISALPLVKEVVVSGNSSGGFNDDVRLTASIYPDPAQTEGMPSYEILDRIQESVDQMNRDLPAYQQIRMVTIREKEFEKTATKKIKRHAN